MRRSALTKNGGSSGTPSPASATDAATAAATVTGNEGQVGQWGPVVDWPVVAVHMALLPNGKVLAYDSMGDNATETYPVQDHTRATVWDPATGAQTPVNVTTGYNIFCSGLAHLMDGSLFVAGGNKNAQLEGIVADARLRPGHQHVEPRAEHGGRPLVPERHPPEQRGDADHRGRTGHAGGAQDRRRSCARSTRPRSTCRCIPWIDVAPDGRAFYSGPDQTMRSLDTAGGGSWQSFGQRDTYDRGYGSHALYDVGQDPRRGRSVLDQ